MDNDEYGVKLGLDLTDFKKGVKEAKKSLKDLKGDNKAKIISPEEAEEAKKLQKEIDRINKNIEASSGIKGYDEMMANFRSQLEKTTARFNEITQKANTMREVKVFDGGEESVIKMSNAVNKVQEDMNKVRDIKVTGIDESFGYLEKLEDKGVIENFAEGLRDMDLTPLRGQLKMLQEEADELEKKTREVREGGISLQDIGKTDNPMLSKYYEDLEKIKIVMAEIDSKTPKININASGINETNTRIQSIKQGLIALGQDAGTAMGKIASGTQKTMGFLGKMGSLIASAGSKLKQLGKKGKEATKGIEQGFKKGLGTVKKFVGGLVGAYSAYRLVSKAVSSYLAYDQQLSDSLQSTWAGLGSFFAPILEYLVGAFQKLLGYINAVVTALTGINFVARANQKALANTSKQAKKTSQSLASFDELNNINQDTGDSGADGPKQIEVPEVDGAIVDGILSAIERVKGVLATIFEPIRQAWNNVGPEVMASIENAFTGIIGLGQAVGGSILEVWTNGTGQSIMENIFGIFADINNIIGNIAKSMTEAWNNANSGTNIIQGLADTFNAVLGFVKSIGDSLVQWTLTPEFQDAMNFLFKIIGDISKAIAEVFNFVLDMYNKYLKPVVDELLILISNIIRLIGAIWEAVKPVVQMVWDSIKKTIEPVIQSVATILKNVIGVINGIIDIVVGALQGNWDAVWKGMKKVVKSVINGIIGFFNLWVDGLNALLTPVRGLIVAISKAFGKKVSLDSVKIPHIPTLAIGTDNVKEEGIAYLHKGEKVVPADVVKGGYSGGDNTETNNLLRDLIDAVNSKEYNPYITVDDIGKASVNYIRKKSRI